MASSIPIMEPSTLPPPFPVDRVMSFCINNSLSETSTNVCHDMVVDHFTSCHIYFIWQVKCDSPGWQWCDLAGACSVNYTIQNNHYNVMRLRHFTIQINAYILQTLISVMKDFNFFLRAIFFSLFAKNHTHRDGWCLLGHVIAIHTIHIRGSFPYEGVGNYICTPCVFLNLHSGLFSHSYSPHSHLKSILLDPRCSLFALPS